MAMSRRKGCVLLLLLFTDGWRGSKSIQSQAVNQIRRIQLIGSTLSDSEKEAMRQERLRLKRALKSNLRPIPTQLRHQEDSEFVKVNKTKKNENQEGQRFSRDCRSYTDRIL